MTRSSSSPITERALRVIRPKALSSLGFVNLCCSAKLKRNSDMPFLGRHQHFRHRTQRWRKRKLTCGSCARPVSQRCSSFVDNCHPFQSCGHIRTCSWPCCEDMYKCGPVVSQHNTWHVHQFCRPSKSPCEWSWKEEKRKSQNVKQHAPKRNGTTRARLI